MTEGVARAVLAFGPRHLFDFDAAAWAIDSTHGVEKIDGNIPKGNEGEASFFPVTFLELAETTCLNGASLRQILCTQYSSDRVSQ